MKIGITLTSSLHVGEEYIELTKNTVKAIVNRNHSIVYGGTEYGMMKELADTYKNNGGQELIGVMSRELEEVTVGYKAYPKLDQQVWIKSMGGRTRKIFDLADGILILPGGYGTIEELSTYVGTKANKITDKPLVILNTNNFYHHYIEMMDTIYAKKFSKISFSELVFITDNIEDALDYMENYSKQNLPDKFV